MTHDSPLRRIFLVLFRFFTTFSKLKHIPSSIASRVLLWWRIAKLKLKKLGHVQHDNKVSPRIGPQTPEAGKQDLRTVAPIPPQSESSSYTLVRRGEAVSTEDAAFSLYPYSQGGRHGFGSRSTHSLQSAMSTHNQAISSRIASRSSQHLGSEVSEKTGSEEGYTFDVQPSSSARPGFRVTSPTPRRQMSVSLPDLQHAPAVVIPIQPLNDIDNIEVLSPGGGEVDRIHFMHSPPPQYLDHPRITPVMPESTLRYIRRAIISETEKVIEIPPMKTSFVNPLPPQGWVKMIHPEGARYFYHPEKRAYTEANLMDKAVLTQINEDIAAIEDHITSNNIQMPQNHHLFMDADYQEDFTLATFYYFVDHTSRTIFFLDSFEANSLASFYEVKGCRTDSHLNFEICAQYWFFVQLYPDCIKLTKGPIGELRDLVLHYIGDSMTSAFSTSPYTLDDLYKILTLLNSVTKNIELSSHGSISLLARLLFVFSRARFHNFHGEAHARIERDTSVYGHSTNQRTWLIKCASLVLFSAPDVHLRTLQKMWVDRLMHKAVWEQSVRKMNDEWQEFILFATVLLNANVAFLAIQSLDTQEPPYRHPAQILSYLSIIASVGSIILGLLLIRQNRTKARETADDVHAFLERRNHPLLGLETLAILYSLPYALLMWGMVTFLAAFCFICFDNSTIETRIFVGTFCLIIAILVAWCVWSSWEKQPVSNVSNVQVTPDDPEMSDFDMKSANDRSLKRQVSGAGTGRYSAMSRKKGSGYAHMPVFQVFNRFKASLRGETVDSEKTVHPV